MDGLAQATGNMYREIVVGGKTYRLAPPRLKDLAAVEAAVLAELPDPLEQAARLADQVPAEQREIYWKTAFETAGQQRRFRLEDLGRLDMASQIAASCMLALQRNHGQEMRDLKSAAEWLEQALQEHELQEISAILTAAIQEVAGAGRANPTQQAAAGTASPLSGSIGES